ncbi:hypothetical protein B0O80DRAFT_212799 [Mortierella sp. GBAus27b]|nr:hypothetical protein B0O80DRAFT_212799 [Mortierella sp. GBAus27b]
MDRPLLKVIVGYWRSGSGNGGGGSSSSSSIVETFILQQQAPLRALVDMFCGCCLCLSLPLAWEGCCLLVRRGSGR